MTNLIAELRVALERAVIDGADAGHYKMFTAQSIVIANRHLPPALIARISELERDAERYHYWAAHYRGTFVVYLPSRLLKFDPSNACDFYDNGLAINHLPLVDMAIDAAIDAQRERGNGQK